VRTAENREVLGIVFGEVALLTCRMTKQAFAALVRIALDAVVLGVRVCLIVLMAGETRERLSVLRIGMTRRALGPLVCVRTAENREVLGIVFGEVALFPGRMTSEASRALVRVARHTSVEHIHIGLTMLVATQTRVVSESCGIVVALCAVAPDTIMASGEHREEYVMVEQIGRAPIIHFMTILAIGGKRIGYMCRVGTCEIILLMAPDAIRSLHGKITLHLILVATFAVHKHMLAHQRELRSSMDRLGIDNFPALEGMAARTIPPHHGLVHIFMARKATFSRLAEISDVMARRTGHFPVPVPQREGRVIMVEANSSPGFGDMTCFAIEILLSMWALLRIHPNRPRGQSRQQHHSQPHHSNGAVYVQHKVHPFTSLRIVMLDTMNRQNAHSLPSG